MATVSETGRRPAPAWRKGMIGELWAEFFGTFILIAFGDGVVAMLWALVGSGRSSAGALQSSGDWLLIGWGWALAVTFAVYTVGGITGAHINPAVTFGAAIRKQLPWSKVPRYWAAQVLGAFVGAALVFLVYNNAINNYDQVHHIVKGTANSVSTYSTFATFPAPYFHNILGPLVDQIVGTFFLVLFIWAIGDEFNIPVGANLAPFIVGLIVLAVGISFGANAGYAINPARDFGPRMFALIAGWGKVAFPGNYGNINDYFWIPIVGPLIGGGLASFAYDIGVRDFLIARLGEKPGVRGSGENPEDLPFEPEA
ncbi:MAG TPA: MIP/aquaporin family protein [Solirubrobacteraceae bacterium]|nr:MIP/aquaporin family protein [Solirubrobacteraceae bacterium]